MTNKEIDLLMTDVVELEKVKMKLVKEQDFASASIIRAAQSDIRSVIRYFKILEDKEPGSTPTSSPKQ